MKIDKRLLKLNQIISKDNGEAFTDEEIDDFFNAYADFIDYLGYHTNGELSYSIEEER